MYNMKWILIWNIIMKFNMIVFIMKCSDKMLHLATVVTASRRNAIKLDCVGGDDSNKIMAVKSMELNLIMWLTHWGRVTHICVSDLTIIGSDNGLSPGRRQAIIRTNAGILLIRPLGTNFSDILIEILLFSFKKMRLKVSSAKRRPFCLGLNVLIAASMPGCYNLLYRGKSNSVLGIIGMCISNLCSLLLIANWLQSLDSCTHQFRREY